MQKEAKEKEGRKTSLVCKSIIQTYAQKDLSAKSEKTKEFKAKLEKNRVIEFFRLLFNKALTKRLKQVNQQQPGLEVKYVRVYRI